ncbi:MAG: hypothetical protein NTX13_07820 [Acidobacteria bacterium]|nr:hypothetical protein [Acidobacteriota bacterium]
MVGDKTHRWSDEAGTIVFSGAGEPLRVAYDLTSDLWTWKFPDGQMQLHRLLPDAAPASAGQITGAW